MRTDPRNAPRTRARFYHADGSCEVRDIEIPESAMFFTERVQTHAHGGSERTFKRRRYRVPANYYGPVRDDDWHICECLDCFTR